MGFVLWILVLAGTACAHRYSEDWNDWLGSRNASFEADLGACRARMDEQPFRFGGDPRLIFLDCMEKRGWLLKAARSRDRFLTPASRATLPLLHPVGTPFLRSPSTVRWRAMFGIDAQAVRRRLYARLPEPIARPLARAERPAAFARWERLRADPRAPYSFRPFDALDCVFVHIPKTGGVSVSTALFGWNAGGHETLLDYTWIYGRAELARRFSFAFVRNPWDRLYSAWRFLRAGGTEPGDRKFAHRHLAGYRDFSDWVARWLTPDRARAFVHLVPQHEFVSLAGNRCDVDFLGRFETLADDFASLARLLGAERPLAHLNRTPGPASSYGAAYTDEARAIAASVYAKDLAWFGYRR